MKELDNLKNVQVKNLNDKEIKELILITEREKSKIKGVLVNEKSRIK